MANPAYGAGAFFKDPKGSAFMASKDRRADRRDAEQRVMRDAKKRDHGRCRWPGCKGKHRGLDLPIDACHETHRGQGGNPDGSRTTTAQLVTLCRKHHQAWDAGLIDLEPLSIDGFDGLIAFYEKHEETGDLHHIATETRIGISETRGA